MAGLATGVAGQTEMGGVAEGGEWPAFRIRLRGRPIYKGRSSFVFNRMALHAEAGRLRVRERAKGEFASGIARSIRNCPAVFNHATRKGSA